MKRAGVLFGVNSLAALLMLAAGCDAFRSKEARIEQARAAMAVGDYRAASIELKGVLDSDPDNADARLALAEASLAVGDAEAADKEIRRALAAGLPPEKAAALQGRVMLALGQAAELLQKLNDRSLPVQEPEWSVLKGDALVTVGETASAESLYRSVLDGNPEHVRATVGLALAAAVQGREQEALDLLADFLRTLTQERPRPGCCAAKSCPARRATRRPSRRSSKRARNLAVGWDCRSNCRH